MDREGCYEPLVANPMPCERHVTFELGASMRGAGRLSCDRFREPDWLVRLVASAAVYRKVKPSIEVAK